MRIGMMADIYKPHISGVTNFISLNKEYLERLGHEVFVFTFKDQNYEDKETNIIRTTGFPVLDTGFWVNLSYSKEARNLLRTMEIVHVHHPFISGPLAIRYCKSRGIPVIFTNHTRYDLYAQAYLPAIAEVISETALETYLPTFCRQLELVIAPSPGMRDVLRRFGVDADIDVIPNGIDLKPFRSPSNRILRSDLGFGNSDVLLIYVGRLGPEKNLSFLLRAFTGVAEAYKNVGLLLVGEGPERENLQDRVKNSRLESRVQFAGQIPYSLLPGYMAVADAFVTASVTEVHPLSVIEAMASGLPVLGIQSPGVGDTIEDGVTGFLVSEEDMAAFTAKLVRMITEQDKRVEMGQQARLSSEQYAIEKTSQLMEECYKRVILKSSQRNRGWLSRFQRTVGRRR